MIKRCILFLMFALCSNSNRKEDIFNLDADDIFASEMGEDFYEARGRLQSLPSNMKDALALVALRKQNVADLKLNATTKSPVNSTTERILMATTPPEIAGKKRNTTMRDIKMRRLKLELNKIVNSDRSPSDYIADSDVQTLTRRFDKLVEENKKKFAPASRRELYHSGHSRWWRARRWSCKKHLLDLMSHFVYISRYKLVYPQLLKKKYYDSLTYKLGFLFALLRHVKDMQKWVLWSLKLEAQYYGAGMVGTIYYYLTLVQKIVRYDIDIKDLVMTIEKMEYRINMLFDPKFYDYSMET